MLLPRNKAHELLRRKAKEAVKAYESIKPYVVTKPVEIKVELMERCVLSMMNGHNGLST